MIWYFRIQKLPIVYLQQRRHWPAVGKREWVGQGEKERLISQTPNIVLKLNQTHKINITDYKFINQKIGILTKVYLFHAHIHIYTNWLIEQSFICDLICYDGSGGATVHFQNHLKSFVKIRNEKQRQIKSFLFLKHTDFTNIKCQCAWWSIRFLICTQSLEKTKRNAKKAKTSFEVYEWNSSFFLNLTKLLFWSYSIRYQFEPVTGYNIFRQSSIE